MVTAITDATFGQIVLQSDKPVLVDFWAPWCGPCKALAPALEALEADIGEQVAVVKIDVDDNRASAGRFGLRAVPTLMLFQGGRMIGQRSGAASKDDLARWVEATLHSAPAS